MKTFQLQGTSRQEVGKKSTREMRKQNLVPCNLYGIRKDENGKPVATAFAVKKDDLRKLIYTPDIHVVELTIDGKLYTAIIQEMQFHPVKDNILHIDFLEITDSKPIIMAVPVQLTGLAAGVKAGGKLKQIVRSIRVKALYTIIPERLVIDVTSLGLGHNIKVGDLHFEGLEMADPLATVVCSVMATRTSREDTETEETEETEKEQPTEE